MHFRFHFFVAHLVFLSACSSEPKAPDFEPPAKQGLAWRVLHPFAKKTETPVKKTGVQVSLEVETTTPSLASTTQLPLRLVVNNNTRKMIYFNFPTAQRLEIIARTAEGKIVHTYSTDHAYAQEITNLSINPGERVEYNEKIPLRNFLPDTKYLVTASLVGQAELEGTIEITPQR